MHEDIVAEYGLPIPAVDAAIRSVEDAVAEIERRCAGEPPGYEARPSSDDVAQLLCGVVAVDAATATEPTTDDDARRPAHVTQAVRAVRETWRAIDLLVAVNAPYRDRLQLHVADAAFNCHDVVALRRAHAILRGVGCPFAPQLTTHLH